LVSTVESEGLVRHAPWFSARLRALSHVPRRSSGSFQRISALRGYLHRYWFEFGGPRHTLPPGGRLGCGVTAVDRADAEHLLVDGPFRGKPLPPVERMIEDVDVGELDAGHVLPNIGDVTQRGVWFPRL
jgi:hypothetical protein